MNFSKTFTKVIVASLLLGATPVYVSANEAVTTSATQEQAQATVYFVNESKPASISSMSTYIANPTIVEKDGKSYLSIDVQQVYDVKITVEGKEGTKVGEYTKTVVNRGAEQEVTFFTFEYELSDPTKVLEASASYFVPGYFTEPQSHGIYLVINNNVEAAIKELAVLLPKAQEVSAPSASLSAAIEAAVKANSYLTPKAELEKALADLKVAYAAEPLLTPVYYVNESDYSKQSVMGNYLANAKTYTKEGVSYLRIDVQQSYDVNVLVEGKEGTKVAEYSKTVTGRQGPEEVTYFTFDFVVSDLNAVLEASASYFVPGYFTEPQAHGIKLVIGKDVDASKAKLVKAITAAEAIVEPSTELASEIEKAKSSNSYLASNDEITAATAALVSKTAQEVQFSDAAAHWAKDNIAQLVAEGIASGYPDGTFQPNKNITRAEFTKLLVEGLDIAASAKPLAFADSDKVPAWAAPYVQAAVAAEVISGYEDNTFRSDGYITRTEMAVMLVNALQLTKESADTLTFADADQIASFGKEAVATAVKHSLVEGLGDNLFGGSEQATRAEAITIIKRAIDLQ